MTQPGDAVEAVALAAAVAEHAHDLGVLLAGLLEFELAFSLFVLVLPAPPVLAALALILRHDLRGRFRVLRGDKVACVNGAGAVYTSRSDARYQEHVERQSIRYGTRSARRLARDSGCDGPGI